MICEEVELELSGGEPSPEVRAHLESCVGCQDTARVLGLAAVPPLSETERLLLSGLAATTVERARSQRRRGEGARRVGALALAAALGALLASAVVSRPAAEGEPVVRTVMMTAPEVPVFDFDEPNLSDDEVFFEVGWPSPTEGDL